MKDLPYNLKELPRELKRHYISADEKDISEMLTYIGEESFADLFKHIPKDVQMENLSAIDDESEYDDLIEELKELSKKNKILTSFVGDGLQSYKIPEIIEYVSGLRGLSTSYTPYQPERSQGTLISQWIYQSLLSEITGMEAVNSSMYDRATALFEAINCAVRLNNGKNSALVYETIYPGDMDVLETLARETSLNLVKVPAKSGKISKDDLEKAIDSSKDDLAVIIAPQVNHFGNLEDMDMAVDSAHNVGARAIAIIDPMLLAEGALKQPTAYGKKGADMIVGEGQHLALAPNWGGPGLGIFGIRYNDQYKREIRSSAGRYIGTGKDVEGRDIKVMVLSAREQHIKREKATSNICSNQAFIATLVGAGLLERGEDGLKKSAALARENALKTFRHICSLKGIEPAFKNIPFYNEFTIKISISVSELIDNGIKEGLLIGVDISDRFSDNENYLMLSFSDLQSEDDINKLCSFFKSYFPEKDKEINPMEIPQNYLREGALVIPKVELKELKKYYFDLSEQNISPDSGCYPLGSCTMKYNPFINDYTASFQGFQNIHPEAPLSCVQGSLAILYKIQELFKQITGLPGVCTQPVAGAQGELVGLKMFQAWQKDNGGEKRDVMFIPHSAHGTNPATATMAGFTGNKDGSNIILIEANEKGMIDINDFDQKLSIYGERLCGMMITNPNTSGIYEIEFKKIADKVHRAGGLVYMDGANMNAIAGWIDIKKLGVDALHNNLHKTWSISHGGGGPGDAIVAVSEKLIPYMSGIQVVLEDDIYKSVIPEKSIGSFHRHFGNFQHKIRAYTYIKRLGREGIKRMSAMAVLSSRYVYKKLSKYYPTLPMNTENIPRMHEFILTLDEKIFSLIEATGVSRQLIIGKFGKLFLDFGFHPPTVSFPELSGLMIEPTESYTKSELDRFCDIVIEMKKLTEEMPKIVNSVPHFTPVSKVDEINANKKPSFSEKLTSLPEIISNRLDLKTLWAMNPSEIADKIKKLI